jgi:hypothetical protein
MRLENRRLRVCARTVGLGAFRYCSGNAGERKQSTARTKSERVTTYIQERVLGKTCTHICGCSTFISQLYR